MTDEELRLRCVELALHAGEKGHTAVDLARAIYGFASAKGAEPQAERGSDDEALAVARDAGLRALGLS